MDVWSNSQPVFHVGSWLWLIAAMLGALLTRNPVYLALVIGIALVVNAGLSSAPRGIIGGFGTVISTSQDTTGRARGLLLRAVVGLTVVVALLKGLSLHAGATVLFTLPDCLPVIGGAITLESMALSFLDALSILAILAVFATFSAGADYYALLRSVPPFLNQVGLITSIAITFVPQTVTRFAEIREAQTLRGHKVRRVGDLLPLIVPLLAGGMERSMNFAEAMEARGFSRDRLEMRD